MVQCGEAWRSIQSSVYTAYLVYMYMCNSIDFQFSKMSLLEYVISTLDLADSAPLSTQIHVSLVELHMLCIHTNIYETTHAHCKSMEMYKYT